MAKNQLANVPAHLLERAQQLTAAGVAWEIKHFVRDEVNFVTVAHDIAEARVKGVGACEALGTAPIPLKKRENAGVQIYELPDRIFFYKEWWNTLGYYGPPAEVASLAGVSLERIAITNPRNRSKCGGSHNLRWQVCPLPSGKIYLETWQEGKPGSRAKTAVEAEFAAQIAKGRHIPIVRNEWRENDWLAGVSWYGHAEDLVDAGVCPMAHLKNAKAASGGKEKNGVPAERRPAIGEWKARRICDGFYEYWVEYTHDEATRLARLQEKKAPLFYDLEEFADSCERVLRVDVKCTIDSLNGEIEKKLRGKVTYRYLPEDVAKVGAALEHALQLLQSCTPVVVRPALTPKSPAAAAVAKAKHDEAFRAFLSKLPTGSRA